MSRRSCCHALRVQKHIVKPNDKFVRFICGNRTFLPSLLGTVGLQAESGPVPLKMGRVVTLGKDREVSWDELANPCKMRGVKTCAVVICQLSPAKASSLFEFQNAVIKRVPLVVSSTCFELSLSVWIVLTLSTS